MPFNMFPFSNLHNLNADWLLKTVKEAAHDAEESAESAAASAAIAEGVQGQITELDGRVEACETGLSHAVKFTPQTLTLLQQGQARNNIGAISAGELSDSGAVIYNHEQTLTTEQKAVARENIGAVANNASALSQAGAVTYGSEQSLTDAQKARARTNIGAISAADIPPAASAVLYTEQSLTSAQQAQARTNIGAAPTNAQPLIVYVQPDELGTGWESDTRVANIIDAANSGRLIIIHLTVSGSTTEYYAVANVDSTYIPNLVMSDIMIPNDPASSAPTLLYKVYLAAGSDTDSIIVTPIQARFIPDSSLSDQGKILAVSAQGRPVWITPTPITVTDTSSTTATIASAQDGHIYKFTQDLTSLSLTTGSGSYMICFHSGSTATTTSFPVSILGLDDFVPETATYYEINIMDGRAVWMGWADPAVE